MEKSMELEDNNRKIEALENICENQDNKLRIVKISITEDIYRKIKSFGVLVGLEDKEPVLFGNAISKLYDLSKDKIYKDFV
ncbi:MAG: hypothetical protein PHE16_09745 [Aliarcobacter sp.]|jgi:hypothetical protein|nr:hypothetical protein [Aliarcobacter sp.]